MFWSRRRRIEVELIEALLHGELERRKTQSDLDQKVAEIELKKRELELAHLEAIGEERRKDAADRQKLREQRVEWARRARSKKRSVQAVESEYCCPLGQNPNLRGPDLTVELIRQHSLHVRHAQADPGVGENGNGNRL